MDWLSVTLEELRKFGVRHNITKTELGKLLEQLHPHMDWTRFHQWKGRFSQQRHFQRILFTLFEVQFM
jgi:hypothetical protein